VQSQQLDILYTLPCYDNEFQTLLLMIWYCQNDAE
jgi:hypothetical protein